VTGVTFTSLSLLVLGAVGVVAAAAFPANVDAALRQAKEIQVATRRVNGEWSTPAPVWFMYEGGPIYFTTAPASHKGKRIAAGSPVRITVGDQTFEGKTKIIRDPAIVTRMGEAYGAKYWIAWLGLFRPNADRVASGKTLAIEVTPDR
jgi:hypothetical protein